MLLLTLEASFLRHLLPDSAPRFSVSISLHGPLVGLEPIVGERVLVVVLAAVGTASHPDRRDFLISISVDLGQILHVRLVVV